MSSSACSCWRDGGARQEQVQLSGGSRVGIRGRSDRKKVSKMNRVRPQRVPTALAGRGGGDCGDAGSQGPSGSKVPGAYRPGFFCAIWPQLTHQPHQSLQSYIALKASTLHQCF